MNWHHFQKCRSIVLLIRQMKRVLMYLRRRKGLFYFSFPVAMGRMRSCWGTNIIIGGQRLKACWLILPWLCCREDPGKRKVMPAGILAYRDWCVGDYCYLQPHR